MNIQEKTLRHYSDADEIYYLRRKKVRKTGAKILDAAVCLFTPFVEVTETADMISDMGTYYLVVKEGREILVRADNEGFEEKDITGLCEGKKFIIDGNKFTKALKLNGKKI